MPVVSIRQARNIAKEINRQAAAGNKGGCVAIRGSGTQKPVCAEMTREGCDELNRRLRELDDGSFALFKGAGNHC